MCFSFWAPLSFSEILIQTNLHTAVLFYRMQWSLTIAPIGKQKYTSVHIRLEKKHLHSLLLLGFSKWIKQQSFTLRFNLHSKSYWLYKSVMILFLFFFNTWMTCAGIEQSELYPSFEVKPDSFLMLVKTCFECYSSFLPPCSLLCIEVMMQSSLESSTLHTAFYSYLPQKLSSSYMWLVAFLIPLLQKILQLLLL
jgi:hypothetical protein